MSGWTDADFEKPIITIGSPWTNANPCNNKVGRAMSELTVHGSPRHHSASWTITAFFAPPLFLQVRELTDLLVREVEARGGKAFVAGTPAISDGCVWAVACVHGHGNRASI